MDCNNDFCTIENNETVFQRYYPEIRNLDGAYFRVKRGGEWKMEGRMFF